MQASFDCLRVIQDWQRKYCTPGPYPKDEAPKRRAYKGKSKFKPVEPGMVFEQWTVKRLARVVMYGHSKIRMFLCECSCGRKGEVREPNLNQGLSRRCMWCSNKLKAEAGKKASLGTASR